MCCLWKFVLFAGLCDVCVFVSRLFPGRLGTTCQNPTLPKRQPSPFKTKLEPTSKREPCKNTNLTTNQPSKQATSNQPNARNQPHASNQVSYPRAPASAPGMMGREAADLRYDKQGWGPFQVPSHKCYVRTVFHELEKRRATHVCVCWV